MSIEWKTIRAKKKVEKMAENFIGKEVTPLITNGMVALGQPIEFTNELYESHKDKFNHYETCGHDVVLHSIAKVDGKNVINAWVLRGGC